MQVQGDVTGMPQAGVLRSKASGNALEVGLPSVPWESAFFRCIYIWLHEVLVACRIF